MIYISNIRIYDLIHSFIIKRKEKKKKTNVNHYSFVLQVRFGG